MHFQAIEFAAAPQPEPCTGLPSLIVLGAVHGNETCGTQAIRRVIGELESGALNLYRGRVCFVPVTNPLAYARGTRMGDRNLNRCLAPTATPVEFEDHVANWLCPLLARYDALLDLHSFHTAGEPFVMVGPQNNNGALEAFARADEEAVFARCLGVRRFVDGWLDTYASGVARRRAAGAANADARYGVGTTEYHRAHGGIALTLECGQHTDAAAPDVAYRAICNSLAHFGLIDAPAPLPVTGGEALRLVDVIDRAHADDVFARAWASFDAIRLGDLIGTRADGTDVRAPFDGRIVFPNPAALPGQEWFYLARAR